MFPDTQGTCSEFLSTPQHTAVATLMDQCTELKETGTKWKPLNPL